MLIKVLPSGVGVYLSPSKMYMSLESYLLAQAKYSLKLITQKRESNHAVYSLYSREHLKDWIDCVNKGEVRFDSECKIKASFYPKSIKDIQD